MFHVSTYFMLLSGYFLGARPIVDAYREFINGSSVLWIRTNRLDKGRENSFAKLVCAKKLRYSRHSYPANLSSLDLFGEHKYCFEKNFSPLLLQYNSKTVAKCKKETGEQERRSTERSLIQFPPFSCYCWCSFHWAELHFVIVAIWSDLWSMFPTITFSTRVPGVLLFSSWTKGFLQFWSALIIQQATK